MPLNKVQNGALTQSHLVDPYGAAQQQKADHAASPKDTGSQAPPPPTTDQAEISPDAHKLVDLKLAVDVGRAALDAAPEPRADRLAEVRERLTSGFYQSAEVRDQVAGRISAMFFDGSLY